MSHAAHFSAASKMLVKARGTPCSYNQGGNIVDPVNIYIHQDMEVLDDDTGASMFLNVAHIAKGDFSFARPRTGDLITSGGVEWKVLKRLKDDGVFLLLEVTKL